jgi:hypothetical protein
MNAIGASGSAEQFTFNPSEFNEINYLQAIFGRTSN